MTHHDQPKRARSHGRTRSPRSVNSASSDANARRRSIDELETENNQLTRLAARITADINRLRRVVDD